MGRLVGIRFLLPVIMAALIIGWPSPAPGAPPRVSADAALLMDAETGQVYFAKNPDKRKEPASLTKLMTAVIAVENGNLEDTVTVTGRAASVSMGSIIDLVKGDKIALGELLKAALICSANDSTVAIAEHVGGSHERFIAMMNTKAQALGLFGTRYTNTNGYHNPNHYTCARDLAVLTRYALGHEKINELVQTRDATVQWIQPEKELKLHNSNRLLHSGYEGVDGVKTGTTPMAGNCLAASATRDGRRLIAIALHCYDRYRDCIRMFDYGFNVIQPVSVLRAGETVASAALVGGVNQEVDTVAESDLEIRMDRDDIPKLERKIVIKEPVSAPVGRGQVLGEVFFILRGQELGRAKLVAAADVPREGWHRQMWDKVFR